MGLDPDLPLPDAILVQRLAVMRAVNPAFIPRNHQVEAALNAAIERDDYAPFDDQPGFARYAAPPTAPERVHQTFCGT